MLVLSPPSFSEESNVLYKRSWWVVNQLLPCRKNVQWEDFDELVSNLLLKFADADTQIAMHKTGTKFKISLPKPPGPRSTVDR